jgi:hypothetical protein
MNDEASAQESDTPLEWITVDFRPAPAPVVSENIRKVKGGERIERIVLEWKCLYFTGAKSTPYLDRSIAGWLIQRRGEQVRVVAGVVASDGTIHPWNEYLQFSNGVHSARVPWCIIEPLHPKDWPSKNHANKRWQEIEGSIIIESGQE